MTNLQEGASTISGVWLKRFWLGLPIATGGVVSLLLLGTVLVPQWMALQQDMKRRGELEEKRDQVFLARAQLRSLDAEEEKASAQRSRLFEIVTGNGDLSTLMAMVDREARSAGVQLDLYEPQAGATAPPAAAGQPAAAGAPAAPGQPAAPPPPGGAPAAPAAAPPGQPAAAGQAAAPAAGAGVQVAGLTSRSIQVRAKGSYPDLLNFLRRLELLNVLVVQSDLRLDLEQRAEEARPAGAAPPGPEPVVMTLRISVYAKDPATETATARAAPPTPGAPPAAGVPTTAPPAGQATPPAAAPAPPR